MMVIRYFAIAVFILLPVSSVHAQIHVPSGTGQSFTSCTTDANCTNGPGDTVGTCIAINYDGAPGLRKACGVCNPSNTTDYTKCTFGSYTNEVPSTPVVTNPTRAACVRGECTDCTAGSPGCVAGCRDNLSCVQCQGLDAQGEYTRPACMASASANPYIQGAPGAAPGTDQFNPQGENPQSSASGATLTNPLRAGSLPELLTIVLEAIVQIGSILLVLALVWVGFLFVMAQGAEEKIRDARGAFVWTVIGGMLLLGAKAISEVIQATVQTL